ncbi:CynX/NimT family MFS transporter [Chryseobacterium balustinum]|uniref:Inner membrane transport protein YeaN n=1 Tax=Chryseobacterium balustinum TaxID=246 RepID=A0AAX2IM26_9FLAO|nr:MFS transporter [Chryseobacterium balustinum]AZB30188.1 MFS transporter [Chryseobacterium balustinum]SKB64445.1 MFS transporter, CP family, cyanate transporter [Chryseobacterium balustinum]SQA90816.1 Inner membrane transport protein YeaN [Chryseobacterium balustinum]
MKNKTREGFSYILLIINVLVLVLVSSNLRSPITSVGPVLNQISNSLHLNNLQSSMLTSIPLMMFAGCSVLVSRFSHRFSINRFLLYALIILSFGLFMRVFGSVWTLFTGSVFIGLGICIGNVITPGYIKSNFPKQIGLMTGIFAVSMNLTAALASGYSVSLGEWTGYGWRGSLGIWLVIALLALFVVVLELLLNKSRVQQTGASLAKSDFNMFKSPQAWNISVFMGLQSLVYYSLISWLPAVLGDYGMRGNEPGWILFIIQISMIPITFIGPIIANKMKNQKVMIVFISVLMLASILMFAWLKSEWIYATAVLLGLSNGLSFSLSILFFSLRTKSSANAIKISGMAQSVGYLIAAFGPAVFGKLHDYDTSWKWSFYFLGISVIVMFYFGIKAARRKFVED